MLPLVTRVARRLLNMMAMLLAVWMIRRRAMRKPLASDGKRSTNRRRTLSWCYETQKADAWEAYLDRLKFSSDSPLRKHLRQLLGRKDIDCELRRLYDVLQKNKAAGSLLRQVAQDFIQRINGQVHVHLRAENRVGLVPPTPKYKRGGLLESFDRVFPTSRPLDRKSFPNFAKLLIVRRIFQTLEKSVGLDNLFSDGCCPLPLVITISVDLGEEIEPFRIHTVTPLSGSPLSGSEDGRMLSLIDEVDSPDPWSATEPIDEGMWTSQASNSSMDSYSDVSATE